MAKSSDLEELKGIGKEVVGKLNRLNIYNKDDLINYFPRRYEDFSVITSTSKLRPGQVTIRATIKQVKGRYVRRGMHITEAVASDETGSVRLVWFNQPYREGSLKLATEYYISGNFELSYQRLSIMNPSVELVSDFPVNTARILPIYRETKGMTSRQIRRFLRELMPLIIELPETLPDWLIKEQKLKSRSWAYQKTHSPKSMEELKLAQYRFGFEELFGLSLASLINKNEIDSEKTLSIEFDEKLAKKFVANLPFKLTDSQRKVIWKIYQDFQKSQPMNRLVEGDVGSGKTVVAIMASLMVINKGYQVAFMAPTEILAKQHAESIYDLLRPLKLESAVGLLVGGMTTAAKEKARKSIKNGKIKIIIGTQTLIQEGVDTHKLALVIIDEQHRFGVEQRRDLIAKAGYMPHVLSLTATPIPRSLALVLYGELDISIIDTKPLDRKPVITKLSSNNARPQIYREIDKLLSGGHQMFVVCPVISESINPNLRSSEEVYDDIKNHAFKDRRVGLLHGKLPAKKKNDILQEFIDHKLDILVSTTVIEVGIDAPGANIIIVESAEQFGLAQIHQLRGRVGRNDQQAYCYLMLSANSPPSRRLRMLETVNDGFKLAEIDLEIRGPGAIYGKLQHGQLDLRFAKLSDHELIAKARESAEKFINLEENLVKYKELSSHIANLTAVTSLN
ncbi:MAG TPA: ATP-dependent DNA helicase RecG [Candidatus Saccharimonadales bacterium]|nr:ATP-dependent DNA helicase RecG [Candidatus Saccharimonadales bacterium]